MTCLQSHLSQKLKYLAKHGFELSYDLLALFVRPFAPNVYYGCFISTCAKWTEFHTSKLAPSPSNGRVRMHDQLLITAVYTGLMTGVHTKTRITHFQCELSLCYYHL